MSGVLVGLSTVAYVGVANAETGNALAQFVADAGSVSIEVSDIADALPWFDNGAAGINIRLADDAAAALADLTQASVGQVMSFSVCGTELVSATVQTAIEGGQIAAVTDGLGTAAWYSQILRGEV